VGAPSLAGVAAQVGKGTRKYRSDRSIGIAECPDCRHKTDAIGDRSWTLVKVFIDSNIPMYVAGREHTNREPARDFLRRVQTGKVDACTSTEVLQEILYRYASLRRLDLAEEVYNLFVEVCPVVLSVTLADTDRARDLVCGTQGVSARDSVHAAVMLNNDLEWIATFDTGFDSISGVRRLKMA
jgi:uncharacterized protein